MSEQSERERDDIKKCKEAEEQKKVRLAGQRARNKRNRDDETLDHRKERLENQRDRDKRRRKDETIQDRNERLNKQRERDKRRRNGETLQDRSERLENQKERDKRRRIDETLQDRSQRLENQKERDKRRRSDETPEETKERLLKQRVSDERRRNQETSEEKENRLARQKTRNATKRRTSNVHTAVGDMCKRCSKCNACLFSGETANFCCGNGKVCLPELQPLPPDLKDLFMNPGPDGRHFRKHLRQYNSLFQMTSFGAKEIFSKSGWNPSVIIQGQVHHYIGSLLPDSNAQAKFIQIYFLDAENSINLRLGMFKSDDIRRNIIDIIETVLRNVNQYVTTLLRAKDII